MKYSIHDYAEAFDQAIANPKVDKEAAVKNFLALVKRNGDEGKLKKIVEEVIHLARRHGDFRTVTIESARPLIKSQEKSVQGFLKPSDVVQYAVDSSLVAGVKVTVNDEMQFDGTLKAKMDTIFS